MSGSDSKVPKSAVKRRPPGGSRKGKPNKITKALKDQILGALEAAGGQKYLQNQAETNANAFLSLIGKVLPSEINATLGNSDGSPLSVTVNLKKTND